MAAPITHIVTTHKLYDTYFSHFLKQDFYIGTLFPDIRYLGDISRDATHERAVTFHDVLVAKTPFVAGMKFHSLLDLAREDFLVKSNFYALIPFQEDHFSVPKLLEDELFYENVSDWKELCHYFDDILAEEKNFSIPEQSLKKWHDIIQDYIRRSPSDVSRKDHALALGIAESRIDTINRNLGELKKNESVVAIARSFYSNLEDIVTKWAPPTRS